MFNRQGRFHLLQRLLITFSILLLVVIPTACGRKGEPADTLDSNLVPTSVPSVTVTQSLTPTLTPTPAPVSLATPTPAPVPDTSEASSSEGTSADKVINNGGRFVMYRGNTYYRQYNADSYEPTGLWGSYNPVVGAVKNMMILNQNGAVELAFEDKGEGNIYIAGDRLYLQEPSADYGTKVYSVSMDGSDRQEIGDGTIVGIDEASQTIVCLLNGPDYFSPVLASVDAMTGEVTRFELKTPCSAVLTVEDGVIYYRGNVDYEISQLGAAMLCSVKVNGSEEQLLAKTPDTLYDYSNWGTEIPCFQKIDNTIYFSYGAYAGTGNFYQGGQIAQVNTDGSGFLILAGSFTDLATAYEHLVDDTFYVSDDNGIRTLYYTSGEQQTAYALSLDSKQVSQADFPVFRHDETFEYNNEIQIYQNNSSAMTALVPVIDYSSLGIDQKSEDNYFTIKDIEICKDNVYYKLEANLYYPKASVGWRDGYKRLKTQVFRASLDDTSKEIIFEY